MMSTESLQVFLISNLTMACLNKWQYPVKILTIGTGFWTYKTVSTLISWFCGLIISSNFILDECVVKIVNIVFNFVICSIVLRKQPITQFSDIICNSTVNSCYYMLYLISNVKYNCWHMHTVLWWLVKH